MDGDDRSKTALRTPNRDDVLVFGPGQTLQHFARLGRGQGAHDEILWATGSEKRSKSASVSPIRTGLRQNDGWVDTSPERRDRVPQTEMGRPAPPVEPGLTFVRSPARRT
jgi:hypothetical protein